MKTPTIAVITPTKNVIKYLPQFFDAINKLSYPKSNIVWVFADGESTDGTFSFLKNEKIKFQKILITKKNSTRPNTRNEAYKYIKSKFEYDLISTVDADVILFPDFFTKMAQLFDDKKVGMVSSHFMYNKNKFLADYTNSYLGKKMGKVVETGFCPTGCAVFRKECYDYFDEIFKCHEDGDLSISVTEKGWKGLQDFRKTCSHIKNQTLKKELKELYGMGYYEPLLWMKHPNYFKKRKVFFGSVYYIILVLSFIPFVLATAGLLTKAFVFPMIFLILFSAAINSIMIKTSLPKKIPYGIFTTVRFITYYTAVIHRILKLPFQKVKFKTLNITKVQT